MDVRNTAGGSLQISLDVIAKIARLAALEVDGVADVSSGGAQTMRGLLSKTSLQKDVAVDMKDGVAAVTVHIIPYYGSKSDGRLQKSAGKRQTDHPDHDGHHGVPRQCGGRRPG